MKNTDKVRDDIVASLKRYGFDVPRNNKSIKSFCQTLRKQEKAERNRDLLLEELMAQKFGELQEKMFELFAPALMTPTQRGDARVVVSAIEQAIDAGFDKEWKQRIGLSTKDTASSTLKRSDTMNIGMRNAAGDVIADRMAVCVKRIGMTCSVNGHDAERLMQYVRELNELRSALDILCCLPK